MRQRRLAMAGRPRHQGPGNGDRLMCATCGCSDDSETRLTDLQSGETIALAPPQDHHHRHAEHHGHGHDHDHDHDHDHAHHHHDHGHEHHHGGGTVVAL